MWAGVLRGKRRKKMPPSATAEGGIFYGDDMFLNM